MANGDGGDAFVPALFKSPESVAKDALVGVLRHIWRDCR